MTARCVSVPFRSVCLLLVLMVAGCAHRLQTAAPPEQPAAAPIDAAALINSYEHNRNQAELQAARDQIDRGNLGVAEQNLRSLLHRQANHREARLLLVELLLATDRLPAALVQVEALTVDHPGDAAAWHLHGMVLHDLNRPSEAIQSLTRAVELEPDNELYRLSLETLVDSAG